MRVKSRMTTAIIAKVMKTMVKTRGLLSRGGLLKSGMMPGGAGMVPISLVGGMVDISVTSLGLNTQCYGLVAGDWWSSPM